MLDYFCYISEFKVDQFGQQIDEYVVESMSEEKVVENNGSLSASIGKILELFSLGITFGRKGRVSTAKVKKESIVQKLKRVLIYLSNNHDIADLMELDNRPILPDTMFATYEGEFFVSGRDDDYAYIESTEHEIYRIKLTCSLKYFSDLGLGREGKYIPHSGNSGFFSGAVRPRFKTLIVIQNISNGDISGTPLYLAMKPMHDLSI